jgi:chromosome segregation ATPase
LNNFQAIGGLEEVKALQQQIAAVRDTDGKMDQFTKKHGLAKKKEVAYDALIARVGKIESNISKTRAQITDVESQIKDARERVVRLAEQSEEEFERFRLELVRFELSQRLLIELKMEDIESFRAEISQLQEHLSELSPPAIPAASSENASIVGASEAESFED